MGANMKMAQQRDDAINERDRMAAEVQQLRDEAMRLDNQVDVEKHRAEMAEEKYQLAKDQLDKAYAEMEKMPAAADYEDIYRIAQAIPGVDVEAATGTILLSSDILFDSGKAALKQSAKDKLAGLATEIARRGEELGVAVEGHTDSDPIKLSGWDDNWDLSTARARAVLKFLEDQGVAPDRMYIIGRSMYDPMADNATREGKAKNRRVELHLVPRGVAR
jgi:chemotaxis protein MotB